MLAPHRGHVDGIALGMVASLHVDRPGVHRVSPYLAVYRFDETAQPVLFAVTGLSACIVVQGAARVRVGDSLHVCQQGSYVVKAWTPGFETEIVEASSGKPYLAMLVDFRLAEIQAACTQMTQAMPDAPLRRIWRPTAYFSKPNPRSNDLFCRYVNCLISESVVDRTLVFPLLRQELLYLLLAPLVENRLQAPLSHVPSAGARTLEPAIQLLTADLARPLRIAEAARAVNMSPSRFAHVFKERTGLSPHQFRKQLRLEHARYMVEERGWSVSSVAAEVGYVNISHFINEFRKLFGRTPGSYLPLKKGS
jgi:AraC-like DNA-binding protein